MQDEQPLKPANVKNIVAINQGLKPLTMSTPVIQSLSAQRVADEMGLGAVVVDVRSSAEFGAGHIGGAFNVQLASGEFEQRVGWVTPDNASLILVCNCTADAQDALFKMAFVGLDCQVIGHLEGGMTAWMRAGSPVTTVPQIDVHSLQTQLERSQLCVVDTREADEWNEAHIAQAHLMPYTHMADQPMFRSKLPELAVATDANVAVVCATGKRSSTAISMMLRHGYRSVCNVTGGMEAWKNAQLPTLDGDGNSNACLL